MGIIEENFLYKSEDYQLHHSPVKSGKILRQDTASTPHQQPVDTHSERYTHQSLVDQHLAHCLPQLVLRELVNISNLGKEVATR